MRVVYLNPRGRMGGAEGVLLDILGGIKSTEPEWKLDLIVSEPGPLEDKANALEVATILLPFPASLARLGDSPLAAPDSVRLSRATLLGQLMLSSNDVRRYVSSLRKELRRLAPDVIHTNGFKMHILAAMAKPRDARLIWHVHDYVSSRPFMAKLMKIFQRRCQVALANSNSVAQDLMAVCGSSLAIKTLYNGIDTDEFAPGGERLDLDSLSGLPPADGVIRVGMLATLARWKGHEVFLRALSLLPGDLPFRSYILGDALYQTGGSQHSLEELKVLARSLVSAIDWFHRFRGTAAAAMRALMWSCRQHRSGAFG